MIAELGSLFTADAIIALLTLTMMEIVLGIDNIVFIAIITGRLPEEKRSFARRFGLVLAMGMRILLLMGIGYLMQLVDPLFHLSDVIPIEALADWLRENEEADVISGKDIILLVGGLFLLWTAVREIHHKIEGKEEEAEVGNLPGDSGGSADGIAPITPKTQAGVTVGGVLFRIAFMDVIFSLDSVITAVGMAKEIYVMVAAVVISVLVMIAFANQISEFVQQHPTVKMLALSFLILISVVLVSEASGTPIHKGYVYFAMAFSLSVEFLNLRMKMKRVRPSRGEGETGSVRGRV
ncbi:Integral membrane protein TerC family protein [Stieleria maiorica]|uniref:Integral membrane protein TerC family protein n=1 Tax=Stieleria maiorica TaxID=2795974 RepID=A0A5B9MBD5_9BACT|nr:TerC family protein [Stieleria maiorica]QEF98591.1 Integral membrane protein TerC family protein [Stieleria maiorica]